MEPWQNFCVSRLVSFYLCSLLLIEVKPPYEKSKLCPSVSSSSVRANKVGNQFGTLSYNVSWENNMRCGVFDFLVSWILWCLINSPWPASACCLFYLKMKKKKKIVLRYQGWWKTCKKFGIRKTKQMKSVGGLCSLQHLLKCLDIDFVAITFAL